MHHQWLWLVISVASLGRATPLEPARGHNSGPPKPDCSFVLNYWAFDLCPLLDPKVKPFVLQWDEETPPTVTTTNYRISISKPLMKDPTLPAHEQCPEGTWICKTVTNRRPDHRSEPPRIVQIIPVAGTLALHPDHDHDDVGNAKHFTSLNVTVSKHASGSEDAERGTLAMTFHGGLYVTRPQRARFSLICDPSAEGIIPNFLSVTEKVGDVTTHDFSWKTKHACGKRLESATSTLNAPPSPTQAEGDEEKAGEGEERPIYDPDPQAQPPHLPLGNWIPTAASVLFCMAFAAYASSRIPLGAKMRIRNALGTFAVPSLSSSVVRGQRWIAARPWTRNLRWNEDDTVYLILDDELEDEEPDVVVWGEEGDGGEEIPLTPSPRKAGFGEVGYGATRPWR